MSNPKTRRPGLAAFLAPMLGLLVLAGGCGGGSSSPGLAAATQYHCPMHPTVIDNRPSDCPICGMKLVPIEQSPASSPGEDEGTPAGLSAVSITTSTRELMGLALGTVKKRPLSRIVRTSARIVADETRLHRVSVKVEGWVDRLFVATTGQFVKAGEPLLTIYSPTLVTAQQEYLTALQSGRDLMQIARKRLSLFDITDAQIARLERTGAVDKTLTIQSPATGVVLERTVLPGQKIMGEPLFTIADLSSVWADADIYPSDLPYVKVGMSSTLTLPYWPGRSFKGTVTFVSPTLDPETRTMKARMTVPNGDLLLKPEMFANARLSYSLGERLAVPEEAVMRTGEKMYAFRDAGRGRLVPVEISIGSRFDGVYEVLSGLAAGDRVVTAANFLVDSESSMRAAIEALNAETRP
ncbi:MAG: efflux RND transporter periplasmic adaptor subunit [Candidatus Riflebacteria bacterium]|nr:efflux RND transporter periplasmic adaptor subunit [Candidatus Riflebacteria bacterium]